MGTITVVTGGAGFIGGHLVARLVDRGETVRVIERPGVDIAHLPPGIEPVEADIRDREAVFSALAGASVVYHLAANPNLWVHDRSEFDAVNHQGSRNVLEAALASGAHRVVHCSTESILTRAKATGVISEDVEVTEADAVGPYCLSKLRAEEAARALAREGHPVLIVNPTMPVGPGDRKLSPPTRLIRDFCEGRLYARMDCTLNLVDVRDVADALVRAAEIGKPGRRYLIGGENLDLRSLLEKLSAMTGVPVPRWRVPYWLGLAVAHASEFWSDHVTYRAPQATVTGLRLTRRRMHFDASRSLAELGLTSRPIDQALADALAWLRERGQIPAARPGSTGRTEPGPPATEPF